MEPMNLFIFDIDHPQAEGGTLTASLVADSEEAARDVLKRELFFFDSGEPPLLNGHLYEARLSMTATVPYDADLERQLRLRTPEGATYSKKY
jgi:hypothetical protein